MGSKGPFITGVFMSNRNKQKSVKLDETKYPAEVQEVAETVELELEETVEVETEEKPVQVGTVTVLNIGKNPHLIDGQLVKHGDTLTLTEKQAANEKLMAKINTAIKCNRLEMVK